MSLERGNFYRLFSILYEAFIEMCNGYVTWGKSTTVGQHAKLCKFVVPLVKMNVE